MFSVAGNGAGLRFDPAVLTEHDIGAVQPLIRRRVLRAAVRHGGLSEAAAMELQGWAHGGGFSVRAAVRIEIEDCAALGRLLRYCARPAFASEQLAWDEEAGGVRYTLPKPDGQGRTELVLAPLAFLDRLAALIPLPRRHRHHYHSEFAPHAALRARVTAQAGKVVALATEAPAMTPPSVAMPPASPEAPRRRVSAAWAWLIARIYECWPLSCPQSGAEMRLIAFITEPVTIKAILTHVGQSTTLPPLAPRACAPPIGEAIEAFEFDQSGDSLA